MKTRIFPPKLWVIGSMVLLVHVATVFAQEPPASTTSPAAAATASPRQTKPVQLSDGVSEILTLVHGKVGDDIVVSFIENSRKTYNLTANEILYLREQKVSDHVLTAMMNQRKKVGQSNTLTASQAPTPAAPQPTSIDTSSAAASTNAQPAPTYVQAPTVYVPTAPAYVSPGYASYGYPYYGYYSYAYSTVYSTGYYTTATSYFIESNLYDVASQKLMWTAQTNTDDPTSIETESANFARIIADDLMVKKVIMP